MTQSRVLQQNEQLPRGKQKKGNNGVATRGVVLLLGFLLFAISHTSTTERVS